MEIDIEALEVVARVAQDYPAQDGWRVFGGWYYAGDVGIDRGCGAVEQMPEADCVFIAAANPAVVLELVRQLKIAHAILNEVIDMNEDNALINFEGRPSSRFDKVADRIQALLSDDKE